MSDVIDSESLKWLDSISEQISRLDAYRTQVEPQLASEFNVLRYARTDEMGLSLILADLLDPKGPHGQGPRFLECFLKRHWPGHDSLCSAAKVQTEVRTDRIGKRHRRVDIEVDLGSDGVLGIENKPWARDQQAQIADYLEHLKKAGRPFKLLYLAGHPGRLPAEGSISSEEFGNRIRDKSLGTTDYSQLREWLRDCLRSCQSERVSMFLRDLDRFIASQFALAAVSFESRLIVESALASAQGVHAAVQLSAPIVARELRLLLLEQLEDQVRSSFTRAMSRTDLSGWSLRIAKALHLKGAAIEVSRRADSALKLALAFDKADCADCFFGVGGRCMEDDSNDQKLREILDAEFGVGEPSAWWGWSRSFEAKKWWNERHIWTGVVDGSLAERIVALLVRMIGLVQRQELVPLFERVSLGKVSSLTERTPLKASQASRAIHDRNDARLVDRVLGLEAANGPLLRALAERVADQIRVLVEKDSRCDWLDDEHADLTRIYGGIGFRLHAQPTMQLCLEFQSGGCRNAIYGLCVEGLDGKSEAAANLRQRMTAHGLPHGKSSPGWVWYLPLETPHWFDQPAIAVAAYKGQVAERAAELMLGLVEIIDRAGVLGEQT